MKLNRPQFFRMLLVMCTLTLSVEIWSQQLNHIQGELLVKMSLHERSATFLDQWNGQDGGSLAIDKIEPVLPELGIFKVSFDYNQIHERRLMHALLKSPIIEVVQRNHLLTERRVPDDEEFNFQWQYINLGDRIGSVAGADIDADLAWDVATGGTTALGDTIVVCVIDDGISSLHPDFEGNLWRNYAEIPDNGVDDDNNGFVDDYLGWDAFDVDGDPTSTNSFDAHGTPVAGIVGATGNNGIGVTGVMWDVKLMIVRGGGVEDGAIASYAYPLAMRRLYNQSGGTEGAFVVATNASWGQDGGNPADAPLWCALYDELGSEGILNACATTNDDVNVDVVGDLPTACPSEYILSVTNMRHDDLQHPSGFGQASVDLGAYGQDTYTTAFPTGYDEFGGTSGATPHVAGAIGLLYAVPCDQLSSLARSNPSIAAAQVRDAIFDGVRPNMDLEGRTKYEGVLNLKNAVDIILNGCGSCVPPSIVDISATELTAQITFNNINEDPMTELDYRVVGAPDWTTLTLTSMQANLTGLLACTAYEVRLRSNCADEQSNYSPVRLFTTDGCCDRPEDVVLVALDDDSALLQWSSVTASTGYSGTLLRLSDGLSTDISATTASLTLSDLEPCSVYRLSLWTDCGDSTSQEMALLEFQTSGCGSCTDQEYCDPPDADSDFEHIALIAIQGVFANPTGDDGGYGDYTGVTTGVLELGGSYMFEIQAGLGDEITLDDELHVWIDWNQDGELDQTDELVFGETIEDTALVTIPFVVPNDALIGLTRMRAALRFLQEPRPCGPQNVVLGEYEDYCIELDIQSNVEDNVQRPSGYRFYPNPVRDRLKLDILGQADQDVFARVFSAEGRLVLDLTATNALATQRYLEMGDLPSGMYMVELRDERGQQVHLQKIIKL